MQKVVGRRFNRSRYDAEQMVIAFAARLQDATDLDAVQADLTVAVYRALEPAHEFSVVGSETGPATQIPKSDAMGSANPNDDSGEVFRLIYRSRNRILPEISPVPC